MQNPNSLTSKIGLPLIVGLTVFNIILWIIAGPENPDARTQFINQYWGEVLASTSMILMAFGFILAARPRFLEPFFGGLDKMYKAHKLINILAMWLIVGHFITIPESGDEGFGPKLGMMAFIGMVLLVLITIAPRTPLKRLVNLSYRRWKVTHKLMGLFFIIGIVHTFLVDNVIKHTELASVYCRIIVFVGAFAWVYKVFLYRWFRKHYDYRVKELHRLNASTIEFTLNPEHEQLQHQAGQFLFISFNEDQVLQEPHPFTISSSPKSEALCLTVKASGDFTNYLYKHLESGMKATIDGAYGMFNYKSGRATQVWIAGGIGVTPFLSWLRELNGEFPFKIDFFYCIRNEQEDLFSDEIAAIGKRHENFSYHTFYSDNRGHINAEKIKAIAGEVQTREIYMCGPLPMTQALQKQFRVIGVNNKSIHFEEFNFR